MNYKIDEEGNLICPNGKKMVFAYRKNVPGNLYGRQEEIYVCEDCSNCPYADQCKKTDKNKTIHMNYELSSMHQEVIENLKSAQGILLRTNRSIQAEGTFGIIKQDRDYRRFARRNLASNLSYFWFLSDTISINITTSKCDKAKRLDFIYEYRFGVRAASIYKIIKFFI